MAIGRHDMSYAVSALIDVLLIVASMGLAYLVRFPLLGGESPIFPIRTHLLWALVASPFFVLAYSLAGMYNYHSSNATVRTIGRVVLCNSIGVMFFTMLMFLMYVFYFSRLLIVLFWLFVNVASCVKTLVVDGRRARLYRRGIAQRRVLVIGDGESARSYLDAIGREPDSPRRPIGTVGRARVEGAPLLGGYAEVAAILERATPDEVVVALDPHDHELLRTILISCERSGVDIAMVPTYRALISGNPVIFQEADVPLISINHIALSNTGYAFIKRAFDLVASLILVVILSPLLLLAAIGTRLSSPGPVIFRQERIGRGRRPFMIYKFRSMRVNDASDTAWSTHDDPRRTRFGAFMRKYSIDELPQLFNVIKGDMSLVGPRPEIPAYVDEFRQSIPLYMVRHRVRPGITGWAQINGLRGDTPIDRRIEYDLFYIDHWSLTFDLRILLMTPFKGIVNHAE